MHHFQNIGGGLQLLAFAAMLTGCGGSSAPVIDTPTVPPPPPQAAACRTIVADIEYRCDYHAIDSDHHTLTFTDLSDGSVRAAKASDTMSTSSDLLFDPLQPFGWGTLLSVVSPNMDRALTAKQRVNCNDPASNECVVKLWYAYHEPNEPNNADDDEWVHVNISRFGLPEPYEAHGWSTWLHNDLALFNAQGTPNGSHTDRFTQIYALRLDNNSIRVERYAPNKLEDQMCLTGRVNAQPPREANACFDGQRISVVRRCESDPVNTENYSLWNIRQTNDAQSGTCIAAPQMQIPVLRTYVMEVDENCEPKQFFSELPPAHIPDTKPENRTMGITPEWGDMLSAISADGNYLAIGVNRVDPDLLTTTDCAGFRHNVIDPANELSGNATRHTHVCELNSERICSDVPIPLPTERSPIEDLAAPGFLTLSVDGFETLVVNRRSGVFGETIQSDVVRADIDDNSIAIKPFNFGPAFGVMPIHTYIP